MVSLKEIEKTISELENGETSFSACEKLAALYVVKDHLQKPATIAKKKTNSEFLTAVEGKNVGMVFDIFDELMDTLFVVNNKAYQTVMQKLRNL